MHRLFLTGQRLLGLGEPQLLPQHLLRSRLGWQPRPSRFLNARPASTRSRPNKSIPPPNGPPPNASAHSAPSSRYSKLYSSAREPLSLLFTTVGILLGLHIFVEYFYSISGTWGISMLPTLAADGELLLLSHYYHHGRGIKVGDVVSFKHPLDGEKRAAKRVVGMEGDFVLRDTPGKGKGIMMQVPKGHCYVVGDNLKHSRDSRTFGPVPLALIKAKVIGKVKRTWFLLPYLERLPEPLQPAVLLDEGDAVD
ncbi:hypothetical protein M8818_000463 [Zalaria obscura]|uniref:Uncharacterized protein n=1 Tax=Zalaria obscura TaxID=2024903 RepID=A0ACC3SNL5_9PEZI